MQCTIYTREYIVVHSKPVTLIKGNGCHAQVAPQQSAAVLRDLLDAGAQQLSSIAPALMLRQRRHPSYSPYRLVIASRRRIVIESTHTDNLAVDAHSIVNRCFITRTMPARRHPAIRKSGNTNRENFIDRNRYDFTQHELNDQELSWARSDSAFFAAGACHILAWAIIGSCTVEGAENANNHRVPEDFAHLPWARVRKYLPSFQVSHLNNRTCG